MNEFLDKEECCGCEACYNVCPASAIKMEQDREGFFYPKINQEKCISCKKCEVVCPVINRKLHQDEQQRAYACYNKDESIRAQSTSGGIFSVIAEYFIKNKQGIVYGAAFDKDFNVVCERTDTEDGLEAFRGSKYVQSRLEYTYREIEQLLLEKKYVLFSGMPCQIEALKSFLGREYQNLFTMDMVCFGIGSPLLWQHYLCEFHDKEKIEKFVFKDKKEGWKHWKIKVVEAGKETYYERKDNLYMNSYLKKVNIRPSCFNCKFKGLDRKSDVTIADCWGIGEENQKLNDDRGLSALLVHTNKAQKLFEAIKDKVRYEEYEPSELMEGNWATTCTVEKNNLRKRFFDELITGEFKIVFSEYFGEQKGK